MSEHGKAIKSLSNLIGVNVSDRHALRDRFYQTAYHENLWQHSTHILVPEEVHDKYRTLYRLSLRLVFALEHVLDDPVHREVMEDAALRGYALPDVERFTRQLANYKNFLYAMELCHDARNLRGYLKIPRETATGLYGMMYYNCVMVGNVLSACFDTEYMKPFTAMKEAGLSYQGATALQETLDVLMAMNYAMQETDRQVRCGRQRDDWPTLVS